jgi:hypothetical protein
MKIGEMEKNTYSKECGWNAWRGYGKYLPASKCKNYTNSRFSMRRWQNGPAKKPVFTRVFTFLLK